MAFLGVAIIVFGCSKDGVDGINGADGNANVIGTNTITVSSSSWTSIDNGRMWGVNLSATGITQSIVDKGIICVFAQDSDGAWFSMPFTIYDNSWFYKFGVGYVNIYTTNTKRDVINNPGSLSFRIVIVSPSNKMANSKTNWNDYVQVKKALNLKD